MKTQDRPIIFFDGVCNLCNGAVQFFLRHDRRGELRFASLQSELARRLLPPAGVDLEALKSVVLYADGRAYIRSEAVLRAVRLMGGGWTYLAYLRVLPRALRDGAYDFIARHRYRWFGKRDECMLPRPEWKHRFVSV